MRREEGVKAMEGRESRKVTMEGGERRGAAEGK